MTQLAYRIAKSRHATDHATLLSGVGAARFGGRWNSPSRRMVYASDSRALALLEIVVHVNQRDLLDHFCICRVEIPAELCETVAPIDLPEGWREPSITPRAAQAWGDLWLARGLTPAVRVPSVIVPQEYNVLLNPAHAQFDELAFGPIEPQAIDQRIGAQRE